MTDDPITPNEAFELLTQLSMTYDEPALRRTAERLGRPASEYSRFGIAEMHTYLRPLLERIADPD